MRGWFGRSAPIGVQVALLVFLSFVVAQAVNLAIVLAMPRPDRPDVQPARAAQLLTGAGDDGDFRVSDHDGPPDDDYEDAEERAFREALARSLTASPDAVRAVFHSGPPETPPPGPPPDKGPGSPPPGVGPRPRGGNPAGDFVAARRLPDGRWQWLEQRPAWLDDWQRRVLVWLLLSGLLVAPVAFLFARRFLRPVHAFAAAAERIGTDPQAAPPAVRGPREIEHAADAFRNMQARLARYVEDRTAMVAAIAHDLRTPLTRLAFRLEALPEREREAAVADIEEMQRMISGALDYVRGLAGTTATAEVDLAALVRAAAQSLAHEEGEIAVAPHPPLRVAGDPLALQRLLANLLANALRHGGGARVRLRAEKAHALVEIDDDGPGIPDADLERVFEPFARLDPSRAGGGHGLGLAIARTIAIAHAGFVALRNRPEGGLRATLSLPRSG